jgi:type IV pilus assembly protein PilB
MGLEGLRRNDRRVGKHAASPATVTTVEPAVPAVPAKASVDLTAARPKIPTARAAAATRTKRTPQTSDPQLFGELVVSHKVVTRAAVDEALSTQAASGHRIGAVLVQRGLLTDVELAQTLSAQLGLPLADLQGQRADGAALSLIPETVARERVVVPLALTSEGLQVAAAEPDRELAASLATIAGRPVTLLVAPRSEVLYALNTSYRSFSDIEQQIAAFTGADRSRGTTTPIAAVASEQDSPVVTIANEIITQALRDRASDIHIEPQDQTLRIRFRVDGALHDALALPGDMGAALISRIKILAGMNIVERRRPQDGQISMKVDDRDLDIRVATTATIWGETCVMRLLDKNRTLLRLDDLGMPADKHEEFAKLARSPFGMVLCAGPTGSGKTTTLYATLAELNEPHRNIMTIEDPVEYVLPSINQIQMNETAGISFATGLKSILRQDPDVVLVGEIRDVETARIAVQSALTGHFVLSSLHATDAVAALHRFLDMGIESFLIASSVMGIVGQRLVRRICTYCKVPTKPSAEDLAFYNHSGAKAKRSFYAGAGCNFCSGTGYLGRIGVYELLRITPEIKRLVVGWATQEELRRLAVSQGMRTLQDEALSLIEQDVTTISEVVRAIYAL